MRRMTLLAAIVALTLVPTAGAWTWPAQGPVLRPFAFDPNSPYAAGQHRGVDIGGDAGSTVVAAAGGVVSFAGAVPHNGKTVSIETADGYTVTHVQLGSIAVRKGDSVAEGDAIGTIGQSEEDGVPQPHMHLGIRVTSEPQGYVDPLGLLPAREGSEAPSAETPTDPAPAPVPDPVPAAGAEETAVPSPSDAVAAPPLPETPDPPAPPSQDEDPTASEPVTEPAGLPAGVPAVTTRLPAPAGPVASTADVGGEPAPATSAEQPAATEGPKPVQRPAVPRPVAAVPTAPIAAGPQESPSVGGAIQAPSSGGAHEAPPVAATVQADGARQPASRPEPGRALPESPVYPGSRTVGTAPAAPTHPERTPASASPATPTLPAGDDGPASAAGATPTLSAGDDGPASGESTPSGRSAHTGAGQHRPVAGEGGNAGGGSATVPVPARISSPVPTGSPVRRGHHAPVPSHRATAPRTTLARPLLAVTPLTVARAASVGGRPRGWHLQWFLLVAFLLGLSAVGLAVRRARRCSQPSDRGGNVALAVVHECSPVDAGEAHIMCFPVSPDLQLKGDHLGVATDTEDPGRARVAVCVGSTPPRTRRRLRRAGGRGRPLPPPARQRRPDGQRNGRARHAGHGRRRSGAALVP